MTKPKTIMKEKPKTINERELEILEFWKKDKTFEKSLKQTKDSKPYIFYDGPPFATGTPHQGTLLGSIVKDVFGRFWTMKDRYVRRVWGWDCHGLPIENIAEKDLKINSKDEIEKIGVKKFNDYCRSKVLGYADEWKKTIDRVGRWVDMKNCYKTMNNEYIESVWWAFKQLYEKGYIYEGEKILMYCPRCSTPLAKAEIAMDNSYKNITDQTVVVKFKIEDEKNTYVLAWTTTPWTLPSNLALSVKPEMTYVYIKDKQDSNTYILAKSLLEKFYKSSEEYIIEKEILGEKLVGKKYEPLFDYFKNLKNSFRIIPGEFVTDEDGTGIVHTAPAFGEEDYLVSRANKIDFVQPVDEKGKFTKEVKDFEGIFVHDSNSQIIKKLKSEGKIVSVKSLNHEYPFCYRCDTKLLYRAIPAWFVDIQKIKPRLLQLNKKLKWHPEFLKEGRVKYTIETAPDWNISRNRYWATAMPIWKAEDGELLVIESVKELKKYATNLPKNKEINLHKDFLDEIILEKNKKEFKRIPEVLDCWFESGSMTFAQFHYPFENKDFFEKNFPAQYVAEYVGQIRAWFYYMLVLSAILFDKIPFENIVSTGTVLAEDGEKISKSKKNYTDPTILMEKYSADAFRFYLMNNPVMDADNLKFSDRDLEDTYKKVSLMLYNVVKFNELYNNIKPSKKSSEELLDKWIISKIENLTKTVSTSLEEYNTIKACTEIKFFIEDLSTWYVRRSRDRFNENNSNAKTTLNYVLEKLALISAPIIPFASEGIWKSLENKTSVHLEKWPKVNEKKIDTFLERQMEFLRSVVSEGLKQRDINRIPLKQPLPKISFKIEKHILNKKEDELMKIIAEELNVKEVELENIKKTLNKEDIEVKIDTKITPELEAEGFAREIIRAIQAARKKAGLVKEDLINIQIGFKRENQKIIEKFVNDETKRIGAKEIIFEEKNEEKKFNYFEEGKIKENSYFIGFF